MSIASSSNNGSVHMVTTMTPSVAVVQGESPTKPKLMLPREAIQAKPSPPVPASWGSIPAASPTSKPMVTPINAASTSWRTTVCPFAPQPRRTKEPGSLDPTPSGASSTPGMVTPANIWPEPSPSMLMSQWNRGMQLAAGGQSPFSTDVTPIAGVNGSISTRSRKTSVEWLRPIFDVPAGTTEVEPPSPSSLPMRGTSSMSLGLNTARIMEDSVDMTPSSYAGGESTKADALDGQAFFFSRPSIPDSGPAFNFRNIGA